MIEMQCLYEFILIMFCLKLLHRFYHGDGEDQVGHVGMFLNGQGRYAVLWETMNREGSDIIAEGFGPISGLSRRSIEDVIRSPTLSGNKRINGRQLMSKAKVALREAKVLLGFWSEFTKNVMPSGKDATDAIKHVLNRAFQEKSAECDDNDDDDDDENVTAPSTYVKQRALCAMDKNVDSDSENDEGEELNQLSMNNFLNAYGEPTEDEGMYDGAVDVNEDSSETTRTPNFYPAALLLFMLYGPYGVEQYAMEVSPAFSIDTEGIDESTKNGKMNTNSFKEEHRKDNDKAR